MSGPRAATQRERDNLLLHAPVATALLTGREHLFELANPLYCQMVGRSDLVGQTYLRAFPELQGTPLPGILDRVYRTGEAFTTGEQWIPIDADGDGVVEDHYFKFNLEPLRDPSGSIYGMMAVAVDITAQVGARRAMERAGDEREKLLAALEAASRVKDEFLAMLGHELRNPLAPIVTALQVIKHRGAGTLTREHHINDAPHPAPDWNTLNKELIYQLNHANIPKNDVIEWQMDVLRHYQHAQVFRLLVTDLEGSLLLETLSDHLTALADLILDTVLNLAWSGLKKSHREKPAFATIGYGKLGGKELCYASDLDMIFLYDDDHPDAAEIYTKLGQSINTWLTRHTSAGLLYETDLRLRPNGATGLLVNSIEAFAQYQHEQAWVWEHQALTRARFVVGDKQVGAAFENTRKEILCKPRNLIQLKQDILKMREKMLDAHPNPTSLFDIKHDRGGIIDVEFMVQYLVLGYAHQYPQLTGNIGNIALLKLAGELKLIPANKAEAARSALPRIPPHPASPALKWRYRYDGKHSN